jgi:hypothetical protein
VKNTSRLIPSDITVRQPVSDFCIECLAFAGHEALELYSVVTNTTSQWVCQSENPAVVYTDLCCFNPVSLVLYKRYA